MQNSTAASHLIVQFRTNSFYGTGMADNHFAVHNWIHEPNIDRYTFLVKLDLVEAFFEHDFALYRMVETPPEIIGLIPSVEVDYSVLDDNSDSLYCLQNSITDLGKLLNTAKIEGLVNHFGPQQDLINGAVVHHQGLRYLIRGYFKFGSSGAPYLRYDGDSQTFKVNAIQSEACPIQLTINGDRSNSAQWVNALASPLRNIQEQLAAHI